MVKMMSKITEQKTQMNIEQQTAIDKPIDAFVKIVAGAGTGKTQIISKRFCKLVFDIKDNYPNDFLERLLVITFTDKAANEMKSRILKELGENEIEYFGQENSISTIHGFCSKFLRKHSIEVNLSPNFKLADELQKQEIYQNIIDKIKYNESREIADIEEICNELEIPVSVLDASKLVDLTNVDSIENIFESVFNIIKQIKSLGMTPLEFYKKSTMAIKDFSSVLKSLPFGFDKKEDYIKVWNDVLRPFQDISLDFNIDTINALAKDKVVLDKHSQRNAYGWTAGEDYIEFIDNATLLELYLTQIIAIVYSLYQRHLEEKDLLDFDDLINKTLYVLENNIAIKSYYQKFFKHVIVDEFQDTSTAQLRLIMDLLPDQNPNLTIVGDRKQSIYGFRYAKMENLDIIQSAVEKKYKNKYKPIQLIKNYRSNQDVLDVVNNITQNELKLDENLQAGAVPEYLEAEERIKMTNLVNIFDSQECKIKEAKYIASEILQVKEKNNLKYKDFAILVKSHFQSNLIEEQLNLYGIPVIKKNNLNYFLKPHIVNIMSILKFAQNMRNEIALIKILEIKFSQKEILNLKYAIDAILYNLDILIKEKDLNFADKLIYIFNANKISDLDISEEFKIYLLNILKTLNEIQNNKKELSVIAIFNRLVEKIQPYIPKNSFEQQSFLIDLMIFEKIVVDYAKTEIYSNLKTLNEYISKIKEEKDFELPEISNEQIDAVQILTVHASKGLEFPYVFLPIFSNKSNPDKNSISFELRFDSVKDFGIIINKLNGKKTPKSEIFNVLYNAPRLQSEQKRLFYVALSRAKYFLNIISFEKFKKNAPIDYVCNLQDSFINFKNDIDVDEISVEKKTLPYIKVNTFNKQNSAPLLAENVEEKEKFSFSKINTFNHCNKLYALKYVYGYPPMKDINVGLQVGAIVHNLIADFYLNKKSCSNLYLDEYLKKLELDEKLKSEIKKIYSLFLESEYTNVKENEYLSEYHFDFVYNNVQFSGDIDLLIKNSDGTFDIVDFKTNKNIEKSLLDYNKQLFIYKKSMENMGYKINNVYLVNLREIGISKIFVSEQDLNVAQSALDLDIKNILQINLSNPSRSLEHCNNCDYKYICE